MGESLDQLTPFLTVCIVTYRVQDRIGVLHRDMMDLFDGCEPDSFIASHEETAVFKNPLSTHASLSSEWPPCKAEQ